MHVVLGIVDMITLHRNVVRHRYVIEVTRTGVAIDTRKISMTRVVDIRPLVSVYVSPRYAPGFCTAGKPKLFRCINKLDRSSQGRRGQR